MSGVPKLSDESPRLVLSPDQQGGDASFSQPPTGKEIDRVPAPWEDRRGRRRSELSQLYGVGPSKEKYAAEKAAGLRRKNGAAKLKRLTPKHYKMIEMHLDGFATWQIAKIMKTTDATVSTVLHDPLSQDLIQRSYQDHKMEIRALVRQGVDVVRHGLTATEGVTFEQRLKSIDRLKTLTEMTDAKKEEETAEDVVAQIMARFEHVDQVNIQVNHNGSAQNNPRSDD